MAANGRQIAFSEPLGMYAINADGNPGSLDAAHGGVVALSGVALLAGTNAADSAARVSSGIAPRPGVRRAVVPRIGYKNWYGVRAGPGSRCRSEPGPGRWGLAW